MYIILTNLGFVMNPKVRGTTLQFKTKQEAYQFINKENKWLVTEVISIN